MKLQLLFLSATILSIHLASAAYDIEGKLTCSCQNCRFLANFQLYEKSEGAREATIKDRSIAKNGQYKLHSNGTKLSSNSEPYVVVRHDCVTSWWNGNKKLEGKRLCYVEQQKKTFKVPTKFGQPLKLDLQIGQNTATKGTEHCLPEAEYRRIFGRRSLNGTDSMDRQYPDYPSYPDYYYYG